MPVSPVPLPAGAAPVPLWCKLLGRDGRSVDEAGGQWGPSLAIGPTLSLAVPGPGRYRLELHVNAGRPGYRILKRTIVVGSASEETVAADEGQRIRAEATSSAAGSKESAASVATYRDMLAAVYAAEQFTQAGDKRSYEQAANLLEPVNARLHEIYPVLLNRRDERGFSKNAIDRRFGAARDNLKSWLGHLYLDASIKTDPHVRAFRAAEAEIKMGTGEKADISDLQALDDAAITSAKAVGIGALAVVAAPIAIEVIAAIGAEAAGLQIGARLYTWAVANPQSALFLAEYLAAIGIGVLDQGPEKYFRQIESNEDLAWAVLHTLMDLAQHRAGIPGAEPAPRSRRGGAQPRGGARPVPVPETEAAPASAGRRTIAEHPIEIAEATHHLRVKQRADGTYEVTLCSDCEAVRLKIQEVLATAPTKGPNKALRGRLERLAARVEELEKGLADGSIRHTEAPEELNRIAGHLRDAYRKFPGAAQDLCVFCTFRARLDHDALATRLGYEKTSRLSHGQPVYQRANSFISPDVDGHNGGIWKKALGDAGNLARKNTREGTYNEDLSVRVGD